MKWLFRHRTPLLSRAEDVRHEAADAVPLANAATKVLGDAPIRTSAEDTLGRDDSSGTFVSHLMSLDPTDGLVIGVLGPWGSGKTSFLNLARSHLENREVPVITFNPWMFSGADQLVEAFFVEVSAELKLRSGLAELGSDLEEYGEAFSGLGWVPLLGPWIERGRGATKVLAAMLKRRKQGIGGRREKLWTRLARLEKPLVVCVDDIDRLTTREIREVFKLVRLTANFPNVIYLVAFDRTRVESALAEEGIPGREYLEKILQVAFDLPAPPSEVLNREIFQAIDYAIAGVERCGPFDEHLWPDVYIEVVRPLISNMRDVRRYAAAVHGTVRELKGHVALVDLLALEAIRVFLPDTFRSLSVAFEALTTPSELNYGSNERTAPLKSQIEELVAAGAQHAPVVHALVQRLFPSAHRHIGGSHYGSEWKSRWIRERRVAHEDVLRMYLERQMSERFLAFTDAERAWVQMGDRSAFEAHLRTVERSKLQDVVSSLEAYEEDYRAEHVVPGTVVLLNLLPELPERSRGMFDLDTRMVVGRVTYRLLRSLKSPAAIEAAVQAIMPELTSLSGKLQLITQVGYREGAGHKLISESAATRLDRDFRLEVRSAPASALLVEPDLLRILFTVRRDAGPDEPQLDIPPLPELTLAILRSARSDVRSQSLGSRAVRRSPRLAWDVLVELYGSESTLRERIDDLKQSSDETEPELLELALRYAGGWRPDDFSDD